MAEMKFTESQQNAIDARGGSIIVSAAAGSGKTRVLVQRVIKMLTDKEAPISADRLLIVTFTNAAAAEMKGRIIDALDESIKAEPENEFLKAQRRLLPHADICTIHSFCSRIIRSNFFLLNIGQDFRIASEGESQTLKDTILTDLLDKYYDEKDNDFLSFAENISSSKNDKAISDVIIALYNYIMSHPFPKQWIDKAVEQYQSSQPIADTIYGEAIFSRLPKDLDFVLSVWKRYQEITEILISCFDGDKIVDKLQDLYNQVVRISKKIQAFKKSLFSPSRPSWDDTAAFFDEMLNYTVKRPNKPRSLNNEKIGAYFEQLSDLNKFINKFIKSKSEKIFSIREEQYHKDNAKILPVLLGMRKFLFEFIEQYDEQKRHKNILDFSDLEHLLLQLLVKPADNEKGYERTAFAEQLSEQYDEIMVDEYQDSNNAQEMIFNALSRNNQNCFVVGDVKQSIYRFREAMPENFINRRAHSIYYDKTNPQFPACIILDRNFRSREGITNSVNYVFGQLMSQSVGDIDYNDDEKLVAAAKYPTADFPDAELHVVQNTASSDDEEETSGYQAEGKYIANMIESMVGKALVTENGIQRPAQYSDFCILMQNMSSHAADYAEQLGKKGIPYFIDRGVGLFSCYEVQVTIAFLKLVDNPLQDIPLLAVLMHPIFAFTPDDLTQLRIECPNRYLYGSIISLSQRSDVSENLLILKKKCEYFLSQFDIYRRLSVTLSTDRLLNEFFERSGFISMISAMKGGQGRVKNIHKFLTCVREYEGENFKGLTGFVRYLNHLEETGNELTAADTAPTDAVRIMTIHHSKGLEFPICILAATNFKGNNREDAIVHHAKLGLGLMNVDNEKALKSSTFQRNVIAEVCRHEELSEKLRVLYVAMTRAKERLIMVSTFSPSKSDNSAGNQNDNGNTDNILSTFKSKLCELSMLLSLCSSKISPAVAEQASNLSDWILMCALRHPSMQLLRRQAGKPNLEIVPTQSKWTYVLSNAYVQLDENCTESKQDCSEINDTLMRLMHERLNYQYPYYERTNIPSKVSASGITHSKKNIHYAAKTRPQFMQTKKLSGTERGTAFHIFMQYADFNLAAGDLETELNRLLLSSRLTQEQYDALNLSHIREFLQSPLCHRMMQSDFLCREYQFSSYIRADTFIDNLGRGANEKVILQGAVDCLFEENEKIVIVDYKTDRVKTVEMLLEQYAIQLKLYKIAVEQSLGKPVSECIIYSLHLNQQITIPQT